MGKAYNEKAGYPMVIDINSSDYERASVGSGLQNFGSSYEIKKFAEMMGQRLAEDRVNR